MEGETDGGSESAPIQRIRTYFESVSCFILKSDSHSQHVQSNSGASEFEGTLFPTSTGRVPLEVVATRNLGEWLNQVFLDRAKMEQVRTSISSHHE